MSETHLTIQTPFTTVDAVPLDNRRRVNLASFVTRERHKINSSKRALLT